jgi:TrmH family RNA methyltransferase
MLAGDYSESLLETAWRIGPAPQPVSNKVMESLAEKENPQGILAVVKQRNLNFDALEDIQTGVALVSPQDPGNLGTILRTIDAVGADALFLLDGGVDLYHPTCVRASMGAIFWKPVVKTSFDEFATWAKNQGFQLVGTSTHAEMEYRNVDLGDYAWILILGSEQKGLSQEQMAACDVSLSMPMRGKVSSLNLGVAAGILLYTLINKGTRFRAH